MLITSGSYPPRENRRRITTKGNKENQRHIPCMKILKMCTATWNLIYLCLVWIYCYMHWLLFIFFSFTKWRFRVDFRTTCIWLTLHTLATATNNCIFCCWLFCCVFYFSFSLFCMLRMATLRLTKSHTKHSQLQTKYKFLYERIIRRIRT